MIIADSNERIDHPFETADLPVGDYVVESDEPISWGPYDDCSGYLIERKEWSDFVSSYRSGHFASQLRRMMEQRYVPVLLLEGNRRNAIQYANSSLGEIRRMLDSVIVNWHVQIALSMNPGESVLVIEDFEDWTDSESSDTHSVRPVEKVPDADRPQYIIEGLPGVGPKTAVSLLEEFGSARSVLTATEDELQSADGVGPKTASKIHAALARGFAESDDSDS